MTKFSVLPYIGGMLLLLSALLYILFSIPLIYQSISISLHLSPISCLLFIPYYFFIATLYICQVPLLPPLLASSHLAPNNPSPSASPTPNPNPSMARQLRPSSLMRADGAVWAVELTTFTGANENDPSSLAGLSPHWPNFIMANYHGRPLLLWCCCCLAPIYTRIHGHIRHYYNKTESGQEKGGEGRAGGCAVIAHMIGWRNYRCDVCYVFDVREKRELKTVSEVQRERERVREDVCSVLRKLLFGRSQSSGCVVCWRAQGCLRGQWAQTHTYTYTSTHTDADALKGSVQNSHLIT